ncbi:molybdopterin-dependent oxidoreductase [Klebsiella aerogenes]
MVKKRFLSKSDEKFLIKDAEQYLDLSRRRLLHQGLTLGGIMMLTGCDLDNNEDVETVLSRMSRFNDLIQARLFNPKILAPEYKESEITRPFPFNAFYGRDSIPQVSASDFQLEVRGRVREIKKWSLPELYKIQQVEQITRHICVEGWSAIGKWGGIPFSHFLKLSGADISSKYVRFQCADDYYTSIDMASALHPQTILALTWDSQLLPPEYGYPMKLRIPTKLGYKNPKHIRVIEVTNTYPGGYWEDQGYNWFGGS